MRCAKFGAVLLALTLALCLVSLYALGGIVARADALLSRANLLDPSPLRGACQPLVTAAKDFLGLPDEERFQALPAFCEALREHVGAVEAAME